MTAVRQLTADERAKVFKALADPTRVDIVDLLVGCKARSGKDLADSLGISLALLSHHREVLVEAGILRKERVGQSRVCSVDLDRIRQAVGSWKVPSTASRPTSRKTTAGRQRGAR